jgi:hypothetical protein
MGQLPAVDTLLPEVSIGALTTSGPTLMAGEREGAAGRAVAEAERRLNRARELVTEAHARLAAAQARYDVDYAAALAARAWLIKTRRRAA